MEQYFSKDNFALRVLREFNELTEPSISWHENEEGVDKGENDGFWLRLTLPYRPEIISLCLVTEDLAKESQGYLFVAQLLKSGIENKLAIK